MLSLSNCPPALRGDITKWLQEISVGVYAGQVSAGVRDLLWQRVCENIKDGRAVMVFSTNNEQRMGFRVHQCEWEPIDFDGLKLMMRPTKPKISAYADTQQSSHASNYHKARQITSAKQFNSKYPRDYCVIDIETTGLNKSSDEIIELGAQRVRGGVAAETFEALIISQGGVPQGITELTGITNALLERKGLTLKNGMTALKKFVAADKIVCYNAAFDVGFINRAYERLGMTPMDNKCYDLYVLARRYVDEITDFKLETLARNFGVDVEQAHRSLADCITTYLVYEKLIEKLLNND